MRLATLRDGSSERVAVVVRSEGDEPQYLDVMAVSARLPSTITVAEILADDELLARTKEAAETCLSEGKYATGTVIAPIPRPGKVICIGLNYRDHAIESGLPIPDEPVAFGKFNSAITGPDHPIVIPEACRKIDYEAELVIVIGKEGHAISEADAMAHVGGYTIGHDVSARDWQIGRPGGQWLLGKTSDTFAPIGPEVVTADEVPDPHSLAISLRLNGETMQDSNTSQFIFTVPQIIAHLSKVMTLHAGDVIFTGTPPGVGMARDPKVWLKSGDEVEVEVEGLGILKNVVQ